MARLQEAHPAWEIGPGFNGGLYARRLSASPQVRFAAPDAEALARKIQVAEEAMRVEPYSWRRVMAAVEKE